MSHPTTNPNPNPSSPHNPSPSSAPNPRPETPTDTLLTLRGLISSTLAFRLPLSHFLSFPDLHAAAYTAFSISEEAFSVHLHKYRRVSSDDGHIFCEEMSVFDHEDWPALLSCNMEEVALWAHFIPEVEDAVGSGSGERKVRFKEEVDMKTFESTKPVVMKEKKEGGINQDSTNVYGLCTPIPEEKYGGVKYWSGEMVFIPDERAAVPKPKLFSPKIAAPFPGFKPPVPPVQPSISTAVAMQGKGIGKGKGAATSVNHPPSQQPGFDYGAAVEEAFRTAERIEYVSPPPLFPSQSLHPFENLPDDTPSPFVSASASVPGDTAQKDQDVTPFAATPAPEEEQGEVESNENDSNSLDNVFNDDWMVESSASPSDETEGLFVSEEEEDTARKGEDDENGDSLFVPE